ncbi:Hsp20/alpha crystallin family protein [Salisediminibacterium selenitireducens]|uniref:Heat shock protein Hsp20 n=1 Tax=Bacillus selenitireducens (strain ATCC 700615 / DSM 15326 / MLS10) TaxID=439292 RepID=D6XWH8_BACIE|nr:Hsp20/alpha crystallin family protein [Salisediminibacterium selenitireducens]ADH97820.1 heat shock protein Hsp20 [[Bacillus] selenitireducens MLS10]
MTNLFPRRNRSSNPFFPGNSLFPTLFDSGSLSDFFTGDLLNDSGFPRVDIEDKGDYYKIEADLPGFQKDDVVVEFDNGYLTIHGKHETTEETEDKERNFVRKERSSGSFHRSFYVGDINGDDINGSFKNGVLTVTVPKTDKETPDTTKRISLDD